MILALGHLLTLYFLWRVFGRGHGVVGIVIVAAAALALFLWSRCRRRRFRRGRTPGPL